MRTSMLPPPHPKGDGLELEEIKEPRMFERASSSTLGSAKDIHRLKTVCIKPQTNLVVWLLIPFLISLSIGSLIAYGLQPYLPTWFIQWWK